MWKYLQKYFVFYFTAGGDKVLEIRHLQSSREPVTLKQMLYSG